MPVVRRVVHPLLFLLAASTHAELARQIQFLKEENRMLRSRLPRRIKVTPKERARLVRLGAPLGGAIKHLISIVSPRTFARWVNGERHGRSSSQPRKVGRPRTAEEIRQLVLRIARENDWGYARILGELRKLGITKISSGTIRNILIEHGLDPASRRHEPTWDEFLKMHAETLWACDFVAKRVWTLKGRVTCFLLVFMHIASRRVIVSEATTKPDAAWVGEQATMFCREAERLGPAPPRLVLRDRDDKFGPAFDQALERRGVTPFKLPVRSPNLNGHLERWVQSLKHECLDRFIVFGPSHMDLLVREYVAHYHEERPHQGMGNRPLFGTGPPPNLAPSPGRVACRTRLGGLLKHYERLAA